MTPIGSIRSRADADWSGVRERLRARGLRWTPQRRTLIDVLSQADGHVTGAELVERCRAIDPTTIPSTVYRTLDVLEELGLLRHSHGADGREEFHVQPVAAHGHCTASVRHDLGDPGRRGGGRSSRRSQRRRGFAVDLSHLSIAGQCAALLRAMPASGPVSQSPVGTPMMLKPPST